MVGHAASLEFEEAQDCKDRLDALEKYAAKSTVVSFKMSNIDVFSVSMDAEFGYVNYLKIVEGAIVQSYTVEMKKKLEEEPKISYILRFLKFETDLGPLPKEYLPHTLLI